MGIYAEGATDADFFSPMLQRLAQHLIERDGRFESDIAEPAVLRGRSSGGSFRTTVLEYKESLDLLVVHTDGARDRQRANQQRIKPWARLVADVFDGDRRAMVGAVPVHETEAWMLCDVHALQEILGTRLGRTDLGLPTRVHEVESLPDPKAVLRQVQERVLGRRGVRRRGGRRPLYAALGQSLRLKNLISYQRLPVFVMSSAPRCAAWASLDGIDRSRHVA